MSPRTWIIIAAVTSAMGGIWGYLHERDKRVTDEALYTARVDSIARAARADSIALARSDSLLTIERERADSVRRAAEQRAERAERRAEAAAERNDSPAAAIMEAPDTTALRERVEDLRASHREQVDALWEANTNLRSALAAADSAKETWRQQVVERDRVIHGLRESIAVLQRPAPEAGFFETTVGRVVTHTLAASAGYLAAGG